MSEIEKIIKNLRAAISSKEEVHRKQIYALKETALNAFLECEGYDDFDRVIQNAIDEFKI